MRAGRLPTCSCPRDGGPPGPSLSSSQGRANDIAGSARSRSPTPRSRGRSGFKSLAGLPASGPRRLGLPTPFRTLAVRGSGHRRSPRSCLSRRRVRGGIAPRFPFQPPTPMRGKHQRLQDGTAPRCAMSTSDSRLNCPRASRAPPARQRGRGSTCAGHRRARRASTRRASPAPRTRRPRSARS